jgi:hypothetical protein
LQGNRTSRAACLAIVGALAVAALPAGAARASTTQESIFEANAQLLQSSPEVREATLNEIQGLGADTIRALVQWRHIAPQSFARTRPPGFNGNHPSAYPAGNWAALDGLLLSARARGLRVILTPTGPGPAWAGRCGLGTTRQVCRPSPTEFARFVRALGTRYSGRYQGLPRASRWAFWNEPNVYRWLRPQWSGHGKGRYPEAAYRYRLLVAAGAGALRDTGHGSDLIILGETAPIGHTSSGRTIATAHFFRAAFCLDSRGRRLGGNQGRLLRCNRFTRLLVNGISTHPYGRGGSLAPTSRDRADEITMSSLYRLKQIAGWAYKNRRVPRVLPIWLTEHGYQTDPPDNRLGVPLGTQARWINQSDYIAYRDSWVRGIAQYLLVDDHDVGGFQTGLKFSSGRAKPSYGAYRLPIWVVRAGRRSVRVFGQVRPAPDYARARVTIQWRPRGGSYRTARIVTTTTRKGFFNVTTGYRSGFYRLRWQPAPGWPVLFSRSMEATTR